MTGEYRDRIYIRKDVILKLVQYGSLNQTALLSYCGLNLQKHKPILDEMESKGLITRTESYLGRKKITFYKATEAGAAFCKRILEPYEAMFPRLKRM
jgi:predicted transcriptional regulator